MMFHIGGLWRASYRLALGLALAACTGGNDDTDNASKRRCEPEREPLSDPDGSLRESLEWLEQTYPMVGRYGEDGPVDVTPSGAPVSGELEVRLSGELTQLTGCGDGVEVTVDVALRTDDGALDEVLEGAVLVSAHLLEPRQPDVYHDLLAELDVPIDLTALRGGVSWPTDSEWTYERGILRGSLSEFGSHGELFVSPVLRDPPKLGENESLASPPADPILSWPGESSCGSTVQAWTPSRGESTDALEALIADRSTAPVSARYQGEPEAADAELQVDLELPTDLCDHGRMPTRAHLRTADGRVDLALDVAIDRTFPSPLFFNTNYELPNAYPPAVFAERVGHVDAALGSFAHVGVEIWFSDDATGPQGELNVVGWAPGDCALCEADACNECAAERRTLILSLALGECPAGSTAPRCGS